MASKGFLGLLLSCLASITCGASLSPGAKADLRALDLRYLDAVKAKDVAFIEGLIAPNYVDHPPEGQDIGRQAYLQAIASRTMPIESIEIENLEISGSPEKAEVSGIYRVQAGSGPKRFRARYRFHRIYRRQESQWLLADDGDQQLSLEILER